MPLLNWSLAKHPINWVTITLMLVIAACAGVLLMRMFGVEPATATE